MHFPRLHTLRLGDGKVLCYADNDVLMHVSINCKSITDLDLSGCIDVTDQGKVLGTLLPPHPLHQLTRPLPCTA